MTTVLVAVLMGTASAVWFSPPIRVLGQPTDESTAQPAELMAPQTRLPQIRLLAALIAGLSCWAIVTGLVGMVLGAVVAGAVHLGIGVMEPASIRTRRQQIERDAPLVADLLSCCLVVGASTHTAMAAVADAVGGPTQQLLAESAARIRLGADPLTEWSRLAAVQPLAPIARAFTRSTVSGAPLADLLLEVANEQRSTLRAGLQERAKSAGVRTVGPLGACFLPAFILLGVVPVIASLVTQLLGG